MGLVCYFADSHAAMSRIVRRTLERIMADDRSVEARTP